MERKALRPYLTPKQAAVHLGAHMRTVLRRVQRHELPALHLSESVCRIEAAAISGDAADVLEGPDVVTISWLAEHWVVSSDFVYGLVRAGVLPMVKREFRKRHSWTWSRREWMAWTIDHTTGDEPWDA